MPPWFVLGCRVEPMPRKDWTISFGRQKNGLRHYRGCLMTDEVQDYYLSLRSDWERGNFLGELVEIRRQRNSRKRIIKHAVRLCREAYVSWRRDRARTWKRFEKPATTDKWGFRNGRWVRLARTERPIIKNPSIHHGEQREGLLSLWEFIESRHPLKTFLRNYKRRDGEAVH